MRCHMRKVLNNKGTLENEGDYYSPRKLKLPGLGKPGPVSKSARSEATPLFANFL